MQDDAGIGRSEESLQRALAQIQVLRERSTHIRVSGGRALNPGWHTVRDVTNMLVISEAIVRSAIERRESRGSQWRFDHLDQEVAFGKINFVTRRGADAMEVVSVPLDPLPDRLRPLLERSRFYDAAKLPKGYLTESAPVRRSRRPGGRTQKEEEVMAVVDQPAPAVEAPVEDVLTASGLTGETLTLRVLKGVPDGEQAEVAYQVPVVAGMVILDAVHYVQHNLDTDLACRWNCKAAKCGSCSAEVNGHPVLMCKTRVDDLPAGPVTVHPLKSFPLIKDLVTDVSRNYEVNREIPPFTAAPDDGTPWRIPQQDIDRIYEFRKCIECFLCQDVCHILRSHDYSDRFYGPRFFVRVASLEMHPKDILDRREQTREQGGLGYCNITKCCTEVCPEHIHITDNAIIPLKERVADVHWDPVRFVGRKLFGRKED